jgi:hypothetical protein
VNRQVEALAEQHKTVFGTERGTNQPLRIRIFGTFQEYVRFTTNWMISGWEATADRLIGTEGYNNPLFGEIVTWNPGIPDQLTRRVLRLTHDALLQEAFPAAPRWVRIGSLYTMTLSQPGATNEDALVAIWMRAGMSPGRMPTWRMVLNEPPPQAQSGTIGNLDPHEVVCWAVFRFLASSEANRNILRTLLESPAKPSGASKGGALRLEQLYPGGGTRFETDFKRWLSQQGLGR